MAANEYAMVLRYVAVTALALAAATAGCSSTTTSPTTGAPAPSATAPTDPGGVDPPGEEAPAVTTAYTEAEVQKLFDTRCVKCHDGTSTNVDLSAPFRKSTVGVRTGGESGTTVCGRTSEIAMRIQPGDRNASLLWHKVKGTQDCGDAMPFGMGSKPLAAAELERLGLYIDALPQ